MPIAVCRDHIAGASVPDSSELKKYHVRNEKIHEKLSGCPG